MERELLSAADLQGMLGLSRSKVYEMLKRSDMPVVALGGRKFMHKDLFMKWLERQAAGPEEMRAMSGSNNRGS